ncbi:MAG: hypothetical protein ONB16_02475 [candidate division KSB1 bacterium]|nr:hypothetical protein [candidate division KSB1 bacterium]MDZ7319844.1 hypothetical protein [candidate division KSB1 bacterium]
MLPMIEAQEIASVIAAICPLQREAGALHDRFVLTPSENDTGWFFECEQCAGARCTGFMRND